MAVEFVKPLTVFPKTGIKSAPQSLSPKTTPLGIEARGWNDRETMVAVAQLVEREVVVLDVAGSSPVGHPSVNAE